MRLVQLGVIFAVLAFLAACAVREGDENYVIIEHNSKQPGGAQWVADEHCGAFGKKAVLVQRSPKDSSASFLFTETNVSTYRCVPQEG